MLWSILSETILYLSFSILVGSSIISLVPENRRPKIKVPSVILIISTITIMVCSFVPVLPLILKLNESFGLLEAIQTVLFTFEVGKAWVFTVIIGTILLFFIIAFGNQNDNNNGYINLFYIFIMILALSWSSHSSSIENLKGFLIHTTHFTTVSIWVGILIVVSWFSKDHSNWLVFLKWFTPTAIVCFIITMISGFTLMTFVTDYKLYVNNWMLSYGQMLLIKHLLIIPLISYAFINSILIRNKVKRDQNFNPKSWAKAESVLVLLIFSVTASLGLQSPPHEIENEIGNVSKLFSLFHQQSFYSVVNAHIVLTNYGYLLLLLSFLFLGLVIISFIKKMPVYLSFIFSVLLVISIYLSLMISFVI